ncbi:hypothetical protein KC926_03890 [Candidatus Kaiserbacteria bacterium]|nr:hypothetical protein [Candidatus Kaiserbacteria bacterium]
MKKIGFLFSSTALLALPAVVAAQGFADGGDGGALNDFAVSVTNFANDTLVPLVMTLAFLAFVWGMFKFFIVGGDNEEEREKGKNLMIYATLGFVMVVILYGLVNFFANSLGLEGEDILIPNAPTTRVP